MRIILFSGHGGAGVTTLTAATAAAVAAAGRRTLAFGMTRGLSAAFGATLDSAPTAVADNLWALETARERQDSPGPLLSWLRDLMAWRNLHESLADDVAALPGLAELSALLALGDEVEVGRYDLIAVDAPALRHALDALVGLDAAARALDRLVPHREPTVLDPFLRVLSGANGGEEVYQTGRDLLARLARLRNLLSDPDVSSLRLVLRPHGGALDDAQRALACLALFGYPVDALLCNRVVPAEAGSWLEERRRDQQAALSAITGALGALPALPVPLQQREPRGPDGLAALAALAYRRADPARVLYRAAANVGPPSDGAFALRLPLPFVRQDEISVERLDDAVVVHVADRSRTFDLPPDVWQWDGIAAAFDGQTLSITLSRLDPP